MDDLARLFQIDGVAGQRFDKQRFGYQLVELGTHFNDIACAKTSGLGGRASTLRYAARTSPAGAEK